MLISSLQRHVAGGQDVAEVAEGQDQLHGADGAVPFGALRVPRDERLVAGADDRRRRARPVRLPKDSVPIQLVFSLQND